MPCWAAKRRPLYASEVSSTPRGGSGASENEVCFVALPPAARSYGATPEAAQSGTSGGRCATGNDELTMSFAIPTRTCTAVSVPSFVCVSENGNVSPSATAASDAGATAVCTSGVPQVPPAQGSTPAQTPAVQRSLTVLALPSLHVVPSGAVGLLHWPVE